MCEGGAKRGRVTMAQRVLHAVDSLALRFAVPGAKEKERCRSKLILSEMAQETLAQIKAHDKALRSPFGKAETWRRKKKCGSVLSRLIIHFRQLATNYLPFSSICPSHDRKANVWQAHRWVGNWSLMYGKLPEFKVW